MGFIRKAMLVNNTALVCFGIRLMQTILLTRLLGPAGIGQYALITAAVLLAAQVSALGFPVSFLYYSQRDPKQSRVYQTNCIWAGLACGLIGGTVIAVWVAWRDQYFGSVPWLTCVVLGAYVVCMIQTGIARNSLLRTVRAVPLSRMTLYSALGALVLVVALYRLGRLTVYTALLCFTAMQLIRMILGWQAIRGDVDWHIRPSFIVMRKLGLMGLRQGWVDIMVLLNSTLSIMILKYLVTDFKAIGYFSRGLQIAMLVVTASQAVLPMLFSRWAGLPHARLAVHFEKVMRYVSTFSLAVIVLILATARWVILLLFGREFIPAIAPMMILLPGTMLYLLSKVVVQFLGSRGLPEVSASALLAAAGINAALSWLLIPSYGTLGAAMASTLSNLSLLVILMGVVVYKYRVVIHRCLWLTAADVHQLRQQWGLANG